MTIPFWKMHGAGNDFVLVDDRTLKFPAADAAFMQRLAARRTGVGSEGIILIQPSATADFRMRFFNPDGGEVDMCGNGARCVARLAHDLVQRPGEPGFFPGDDGGHIQRHAAGAGRSHRAQPFPPAR